MGSRVREKLIKAEDEHVVSDSIRTITYVAMRNELRVRMESDTRRGMRWYIDSAQALEADLIPSETLMSDLVRLQVFELGD